MPLQVTCPSCARPLKVPDSLIDKRVKCPNCKTEFTAREGGDADPPAEDAPARSSGGKLKPLGGTRSFDEALREMGPGQERRPAREYDGDPDEGADDRPSRRRRRDEVEDEEDEYDDRPRRRRRDTEMHRGGTVLMLGILSLTVSLVACVICGLVGFGVVSMSLGIPAWVMGAKDLKKMRAGTMDDSGMGSTKSGYICGIVGTVLGIIGIILGIIVIALMISGKLPGFGPGGGGFGGPGGGGQKGF